MMKAPLRSSAGGAALLEYMDQHGAELMGIELALLAACTFGAISTDRYWTRRADDEKRSDAEANQSPEQKSREHKPEGA